MREAFLSAKQDKLLQEWERESYIAIQRMIRKEEIRSGWKRKKTPTYTTHTPVVMAVGVTEGGVLRTITQRNMSKGDY